MKAPNPKLQTPEKLQIPSPFNGQVVRQPGGTPSFMKKLTADQFKEYAADPLSVDEKVRNWCGVPEDRYFTVATWPESRAGEVRATTELHRVVRATKISKSNQS